MDETKKRKTHLTKAAAAIALAAPILSQMKQVAKQRKPLKPTSLESESTAVVIRIQNRLKKAFNFTRKTGEYHAIPREKLEHIVKESVIESLRRLRREEDQEVMLEFGTNVCANLAEFVQAIQAGPYFVGVDLGSQNEGTAEKEKKPRIILP